MSKYRESRPANKERDKLIAIYSILQFTLIFSTCCLYLSDIFITLLPRYMGVPTFQRHFPISPEQVQYKYPVLIFQVIMCPTNILLSIRILNLTTDNISGSTWHIYLNDTSLGFPKSRCLACLYPSPNPCDVKRWQQRKLRCVLEEVRGLVMCRDKIELLELVHD